MALAYQIGSLKGEIADLDAYVIGSKSALPIDRAKLVNKVGGDLVVTAGKTLRIGLFIGGNKSGTSGSITLMYDDDGAGTGETQVFTVFIKGVWSTQIPIYAEIPAEKYVTAKCSIAGDLDITICGIED